MTLIRLALKIFTLLLLFVALLGLFAFLDSLPLLIAAAFHNWLS